MPNLQTPEQIAMAEKAARELGFGSVAGARTSLGLSPPISVSGLNQEVKPMEFQNPSTPTVADISALGVATPQETKASDLTTRLQTLNEQLAGQSEYKTQQQQNAGVSALQKQQEDLTAQLKGLQAQSQNLTNQSNLAAERIQQESISRGRTVGGIAPLTAAAQREFTLKQADVASQALTVSALLSAVEGRLGTAIRQVDEAISQKYDPIKEQIAIQTANLNLILKDPATTLADKNRAQAQQIALSKYKTQVDQQAEDRKIIIGWAAEAGKLGNAPANVLSQVQNIDNPFTALSILSPYLVDPNAKEKALLDLQNKRLTNQKLQTEISTAGGIGVSGAQNIAYANAFNNAVIGLPSASQKIATSTFQTYMKNNDLEGARAYLVRVAIQGLPAADQTQALGRAQATASLKEINDLFDQAKKLGVNTNIISGSIVNVAQKLGTTNNADLSYISSRIQQQLQVYRRSMTGVAFSPNEAKEYSKIFPDITNVENLNSAKIRSLLDAFDSNNRATLSFLLGGDKNYNEIFGKPATPLLPSQQTGQIQTVPQGQTTVINGHTYVSDGTQWVLQQ